MVRFEFVSTVPLYYFIEDNVSIDTLEHLKCNSVMGIPPDFLGQRISQLSRQNPGGLERDVLVACRVLLASDLIRWIYTSCSYQIGVCERWCVLYHHRSCGVQLISCFAHARRVKCTSTQEWDGTRFGGGGGGSTIPVIHRHTSSLR